MRVLRLFTTDAEMGGICSGTAQALSREPARANRIACADTKYQRRLANQGAEASKPRGQAQYMAKVRRREAHFGNYGTTFPT